MSRTTTCTYHCSACGLHFHSLNAFDAHRTGDYALNDLEMGRHCAHPFDLDGLLGALTEDGECRMYDDGSGVRVERGVTIWTHEADLARLRARFASNGPPGAHTTPGDQSVDDASPPGHFVQVRLALSLGGRSGE